MKKPVRTLESTNSQFVKGLSFANPGAYELSASEQAISIRQKNCDKVAIVVSGSTGYEAMLGVLLGENLADAIITWPELDPYSIMRIAISVNYGRGVLFICSNEEKEKENYLYASSFLEESGIDSEVIFARDNVSPLGINDKSKRIAGAGVFFCTKAAGAAAAKGLSLSETFMAAKAARSSTCSVSMSFTEGRPLPGNSLFGLPDGIRMDIGAVGNELERNVCIGSVGELVDRMLFHLLLASGIQKRDKLCTYLCGFGGTSLSTLAVMNYHLKNLLEEKGIIIHDMVINPVASADSSMGATISVLRLEESTKEFYDTPCNSMYFKK